MNVSIEQALAERFAAPLNDFYRRRIIFWHDPDGEFSSFVDELHLDGVKMLRLTETNSFAAKKLLLNDDTESNYLVYSPIAYPDERDDWLLDIELYSEDFRADLLSIRMQELSIPDVPQTRKVMKQYSKFFDSKERTAKFAALKSECCDAAQLRVDILSVLCGASANTPFGVIRAVLISSLDAEENAALANIKKFGGEEDFWNLVERYTGFSCYDGMSLLPLAEHILITALSVTISHSALTGLDKLISESHRQPCYDMVNEWLHSADDNCLYDIAREVEEQLDLVKRFDSLDVEELLGSECFPCINECILRKYMLEISDDVIKTGDILNAVEKRRTLKWYNRVRYYFDGIFHVAQMQQFRNANIGGFHIAEYHKFWKEYCNNYYKMDYYYRQFHAAFYKSLHESSTVLEDLYKNTADYVEKLYKNWYLSELGSKWSNLVGSEMEKDTRLPGIAQQEDFYSSFVKPLLSGGSRVYVIISDALRYEVGAELCEALQSESKGTAKISSVQAAVPSVTKFGMAALLPHTRLQLSEDIKVLCDGESTEGTANREKILNTFHAGNVAITYRTLLTMKQSERREKIKSAQVVYIYHNTIDAAGDKPATEDQVFDACDQAIGEIKNLIRMIVNEMSGTNIIITADHGFLYSYKPLEESDKAEKSFVSGNIIELERRYIIADGSCTAEHMLRLPMTNVHSNFAVFTPLENIRIKKQGGGMNYVHGGISLQESVVPVIEFKNVRPGSKNFVDVKKVELQLISPIRKISNSIFSLNFYQKSAVGGKISSATYEIYMADASGKPVSDKKTVIADKTNSNDSERVFKVGFVLKSIAFSKTEAYYLIISEKDTKKIVDRIEFSINVAFTNDFDF